MYDGSNVVIEERYRKGCKETGFTTEVAEITERNQTGVKRTGTPSCKSVGSEQIYRSYHHGTQTECSREYAQPSASQKARKKPPAPDHVADTHQASRQKQAIHCGKVTASASAEDNKPEGQNY